MFPIKHESLHPLTKPRTKHQIGAGVQDRVAQVAHSPAIVAPQQTKQQKSHDRPLHLPMLAHLGFSTICDESYVTHPDLIYRLLIRDSLPFASIVHTPSAVRPLISAVHSQGMLFCLLPCSTCRNRNTDQRRLL